MSRVDLGHDVRSVKGNRRLPDTRERNLFFPGETAGHGIARSDARCSIVNIPFRDIARSNRGSSGKGNGYFMTRSVNVTRYRVIFISEMHGWGGWTRRER